MTAASLRDRLPDDAMPVAPPAAVAEPEAAVGYPMPPLLRRGDLEVADGGFGRWDEALSLTDEDHRFSDSERLVTVYLTMWRPRPWHPASVVPLLEWGCRIWSFVDFGTPEGRMGARDPNERCVEHALFPEPHTLAGRLTGWLEGDTETMPVPAPVADCTACADLAGPTGIDTDMISGR